MLDSTTVIDYLRSRCVVPADALATAQPLTGGVSSEVLEVSWPLGGAVVKQSLPRLRVAAVWEAAPERILTEARALELAGKLTPGHTPEIFDVDDAALALTMSMAPSRLLNWKHRLLEGDVQAETATTLGSILGIWHHRTADQSDVQKAFADLETFRQLRLEPFHQQVARAWPDLAAPVLTVMRELTSTQRCLVHGDFSPKNVLADGSTVWVLDWEVAHYGNPVFDVAFMSAHLLLKAVHLPGLVAALEAAWRSFVGAYLEASRRSLVFDDRTLARHTACLLLARVDGKSPVEYLDAGEHETVRRLGRHLLLDSDTSLSSVWEGHAWLTPR